MKKESRCCIGKDTSEENPKNPKVKREKKMFLPMKNLFTHYEEIKSVIFLSFSIQKRV